MSEEQQNRANQRDEMTFTIEIVTARTGVSPARVRFFEREGLVAPADRSTGQRVYSEQTVIRIQQIDRLTTDLGVNLAGAEVILNMRDRMLELLDEIERLRRGH